MNLPGGNGIAARGGTAPDGIAGRPAGTADGGDGGEGGTPVALGTAGEPGGAGYVVIWW
ncbi:hypothetical protein ACFY15_10115 [Streptomyces sp. NPDC001373]|uniref:hypothetical protein n=1 Tax=Streptomyces sp. NPDC001373 TaxID=3364565 RepID=UPI0036969CD1